MRIYLRADFTFRCGSRAVARHISAAGGRAYLYHFDQRPSCDNLPVAGVYHGSELRFVFNTPWDSPTCSFTPAESVLAADMGAMWSAFAASGSPATARQPLWRPYNATSDEVMHIATGNVTMQARYRQPYCEFWDSFYATW